MIYLAIFFLIAAFFVHRQAGRIAKGFGPIVAERRWEVNNHYLSADLIVWSAANRRDAEGYASVLYPWDMALAICLGFGLATICFAAARFMELPGVIAWSAAIIPVAFTALDLTEDQRLLRIFSNPTAIAVSDVEITRKITGLKLLGVKAAFGQTALALGGAAFWWLRSNF